MPRSQPAGRVLHHDASHAGGEGRDYRPVPRRCTTSQLCLALLIIGNAGYMYITIKPNLAKGDSWLPLSQGLAGRWYAGQTSRTRLETLGTRASAWSASGARRSHARQRGAAPDEGPRARGLSHVIVVSQKRSGSSFLGELFRQNPEAFYLMEPLKQLTALFKGSHGFKEAAGSVLRASLRCELDQEPVAGWRVESSAVNTCQPRHGTSGKSPPMYAALCRRAHRPFYCDPKCLRLTSDVCRRKSHVALKTIRVNDLAELKGLLTGEEEEAELKVLHLVRDPRAVMESRSRTGERNRDFIRRKGAHADETADLCQHMGRNLAYGRSPPAWLRGKYRLVRYEDLAGDPQGVARELYGFLGWELPGEVEDWLRLNTDHNAGGVFSTSRDSQAAVQAWRTKASFYGVQRIQRTCKGVMASLGYIPFRSSYAMRSASKPSFKALTNASERTSP